MAVGDADGQLLVSVLIHVDPKLPTPLLNFFIGTALYMHDVVQAAQGGAEYKLNASLPIA